MRAHILGAVVLAATVTASAAAHAATYSSRAGFLAALGTTVTDTYENPAHVFIQSDAKMSAVLGETRYSSTGYPNSNLVFNPGGGHFYCAGCNGSFALDVSSASEASGVWALMMLGFGLAGASLRRRLQIA